MNIKLELACNEAAERIRVMAADLDLDINSAIESKAVMILDRIKKCIIDEELSDFEAVERIAGIFEEYNFDIGARHDF